MIQKKDYKKIERALADFLSGRFGAPAVQIGEDIHYRGVNVVVTSPDFGGLLPEQRFHHVVQCIPPDFYEEHLRDGVVWFELAPGESGMDLMKMPRSEDIAGEEDAIRRRLEQIGFFEKLERAAGPGTDPSRHDFVITRRILADAGLSDDDNVKMRLHFIRLGASCDAELLALESPVRTEQAERAEAGR